MTEQREFYLLKDVGMPIKIFIDRHRAEAIVSMRRGVFSYDVISDGEASLLEPAIRDYLASIGG